MPHNSRGVTLIELLAVLTLASICFTLIFGIWLSGEKATTRAITENELQADANLVRTRLTEAFYDKDKKPFKLKLAGGVITTRYLDTNGNESGPPIPISNKNLTYTGTPLEIEINKETSELRLDYTVSKNEMSYGIHTTIYFPWAGKSEGENSEND
ncbi:type II secretion system protein [Sporolactobacillus sp. Y61]|uniref:Type II secretion system protein n=1 Tax=Sporolactobacillus sp. Y61 TaxID=3160863 RepID=A0AAU8IER3_9BACL